MPPVPRTPTRTTRTSRPRVVVGVVAGAVALALASALALAPAPALAQPGGAAVGSPLVIVHNGSVQGVLGPESGGVQARTVTLLAALRRAAPDLLLLSCGNQFGPSVTSRVDGGALSVELMNRAGYDAQALGPHDLFAGPGNFLARARQARFPVVCTNIELAAAARAAGDWSSVKPWVKVERAGRSVLVLGLVEPFAVRNWPRWPAGLTMTDPSAALQAAREQAGPADLTVVLGTMSSAFAFALQRELPWVDLVVVHPAAHEVVPVEESFLS